MKYFFILGLLLTIALSACNSDKATVEVYHWEQDNTIRYYYEVKNLSSQSLLVDFVVEAETEDGLFLSDKEWIEVSSNKTRKSSAFIIAHDKKIKDIKVVDIKTRHWF